MAVGTGGHREAVERTLEVTDLRKYFAEKTGLRGSVSEHDMIHCSFYFTI